MGRYHKNVQQLIRNINFLWRTVAAEKVLILIKVATLDGMQTSQCLKILQEAAFLEKNKKLLYMLALVSNEY